MEKSIIHPKVEKVASGPIWVKLGIQVLSAEDQQAEIVLPVTEELIQIYGVLHGGMIATTLDMVMGAAVSTTLSDNESNATVDLHISYLRPMFGQKLVGKAKVLKRGKRIVVVSGEAFDEDGDLIAIGTGHFMVLKKDGK
jgi:uncharacterized protein (TIGR00369 family)